ncbi:prepilin-type N-terminal cleavage/methylation domain-containing protein [Roseovarius salis]|uniref:prepilin-type N-terminal cleavage/methylation domain-containing protein n=1 Tax=Roseovarius salis TaxID=3376063 RepID=UPI0037CB6885
MRPRPSRPGPRGFTLLELVVAMALFALVSVMALQALSGALHQRQVLERVDARDAEILRTLTLLRRDLKHLVPLGFQSPLGEIENAFAPAPDRLGLTLGGQPGGNGEDAQASPGAGFRRVVWQLDPEAGTLSRRVWPVLNPRDPEQLGPERVHLTGVRAMRILPEPQPDGDPLLVNSLPRQIEVELQTDRAGPLRVVVTPW